MPASLSLLGAHLEGNKHDALSSDKAFENYEKTLKQKSISQFYWRYAIESVLAMVRTMRAYRSIGGKWGEVLSLIKEKRLKKKFRTSSDVDQGKYLKERAMKIVRQKEPKDRTGEEIELILAVFPKLVANCHDKEMASTLARELLYKSAQFGEIVLNRGHVGKDFFCCFSGSLRVWVNGHTQMTPCTTDYMSPADSHNEEEETLDELQARHGRDALQVAQLNPGDIFTRNARSMHYFEVSAYVVAEDDETGYGYVPSRRYDEIIMMSRVNANNRLQREIMNRRRSLMKMKAGGAAKKKVVKGIFKSALKRNKIGNTIQRRPSSYSTVLAIER